MTAKPRWYEIAKACRAGKKQFEMYAEGEELATAMAQLEEQVPLLEGEVKRLRAEIETSEAQLASVRADFDLFVSEQAKRQEEVINDVNRTHQDHLLAHFEEVKRLEEERAKLIVQVDQVKADYKVSHESLTRMKNELEAEIIQLRDDIRLLKNKHGLGS